LEIWRDAFCEALGPNGMLMVDLVPELRLIIGEQSPVPDLPPRDAEAVRLELIVRLERSYKFVHDRVQEAKPGAWSVSAGSGAPWRSGSGRSGWPKCFITILTKLRRR